MVPDNTWPGGIPHAMYPSEHEAWNAANFPGTRQVCCVCNGETDRCEEDAIYIGELGPLCEACYKVIRRENCPACGVAVASKWSKCGMCGYANPEFVREADDSIRAVAMGCKPDPFKFHVELIEHHNGCTIVQACYVGCKTFEGSKLMLLKGTHNEPFSSLDPHFLDEEYAVIGRFVPTDIGWEMAYAAADCYAEKLSKHDR